MNFIELTDERGFNITLNVENISKFGKMTYSGHSYVIADNVRYVVIDSYETIKKKLVNAGGLVS